MDSKESNDFDAELEKEKRKISELYKEIKRGDNEDSKLNWMYKNPMEVVDREDYLLGRSVDKSLDFINGKDQSASKEMSNIPKRFVTDESRERKEQVDVQRKVSEDPLFAIRQKEIDARKKLLNNPVKLKEIKLMLEAQEKKKKAVEKNKRIKEKAERKAANIDLLLLKQLKKLSHKVKIGSLIKKLDKSSDSEDSSDEGMKEKKHHKKPKHSRKKIDEKPSSSDESDSNSDKKVNRKTPNTSKCLSKRKRVHKYSDSDSEDSDSDGSRRKRKPSSKKMLKSKMETFEEYSKKKKNRKKILRKRSSSSEESESESESSGTDDLPKRKRKSKRSESLQERSESKKKRKTNVKKKQSESFSEESESESSSSDDELEKKKRKSRSRDRSLDEYAKKTSKRNGKRKSSKRSSSEESESDSESSNSENESAKKTKKKSKRREGKDRSSKEQTVKKRKENEKLESKAEHFDDEHKRTKLKHGSITEHEQSEKQHRERRENREIRKDRNRLDGIKEKSYQQRDLVCHNRRDEHERNRNYGLSLIDGSKPELSPKEYKQYTKKDEKPKYVAPKPIKLREEEREAQLKAMMKNAEWRKKEQEIDNTRHEKAKQREEKIEDYDKDFMRKQMATMTSKGSIADRIKSNINNIQRSSSSMNQKFVGK